MSRLHFQSRIELSGATSDGGLTWRLNFTLTDNEGRFRVRDVSEDDVIVLDTGAVETGTLTRYRITTVVSTTWDGKAEVLAVYEDDNDNAVANPDLSYVIGKAGIVTRPTPVHGFLPLPSSDVQLIPDRFGFYLQNYNSQVIDQALPVDPGTTVGVHLMTSERLPFTPDGRIVLPVKPIGDLVWNMAVVYLKDGSAVEFTGVSWTETQTGVFELVFVSGDLVPFDGQLVSATVSFLGVIP